jgi:hypothetical protein
LAHTQASAAELPTGDAFHSEWIDFERGIRVGNLEPHERITRILKHRLEEKYGTGFITDRWGRGVYWQWICWLPRANRDAKSESRGSNFGCAKLYITVDRTRRIFQCGLAVERGFMSGATLRGALLRPDWDWHRLMARCVKDSPLDREIRRLVRTEGFTVAIGGPDGALSFTASSYTSALQLKAAARHAPADRWSGFDLFYPMPESEVRASGGYELVQGIMGAFSEVIPLMNMCMQVSLTLGVSARIRGPGTPSGTARVPRSPR